MNNLISIIIPCKNGTNYLKDAIESVYRQNMNTEIIVIDDGSTDGTADYAKKLGADKVVSIEASGLSAARNTGLKNIVGDYIVFLDHDDVLNENALSTLFNELQKDESTQVISAKLEDFLSPELTEEEKKVLQTKPEPYGSVLPGAMLLKKEVFDIMGNFDEKLQTGQGIDFILRLQENKIKIKKLDFVSAMRRIHNNNMGRTMQQQEFTDYASILRAKLAAARKAK